MIQCSVIHGDLGNHNFLVSDDGTLTLSDFGGPSIGSTWDTRQLVKLGHGNQDSKSIIGMTLLPSAPSCIGSALTSSYMQTEPSPKSPKISNISKKREGFLPRYRQLCPAGLTFSAGSIKLDQYGQASSKAASSFYQNLGNT